MTDPYGAAWTYLYYGANLQTDPAKDVICGGASPELTPDGLDAIRQSYGEKLDGITDIEPTLGDPAEAGGEFVFTGSIQFISEGNQPAEIFVVTVQENDGIYCVSNAVHEQGETPDPDDPTSNPPDSSAVANEFLAMILGSRNIEAATLKQCEPYSGITAEELAAAVVQWENENGQATGSLVDSVPVASGETSVTKFRVEVELDGSVAVDQFSFTVGVEGDCIASLEGGEGLVDTGGN